MRVNRREGWKESHHQFQLKAKRVEGLKVVRKGWSEGGSESVRIEGEK